VCRADWHDGLSDRFLTALGIRRVSTTGGALAWAAYGALRGRPRLFMGQDGMPPRPRTGRR
jgi:hypothetical protein